MYAPNNIIIDMLFSGQNSEVNSLIYHKNYTYIAYWIVSYG